MMPISKAPSILSLTLILAAGAATAPAATVTFGASKDNTLIITNDPTNQMSNGASQFIFVGNTDDSVTHRGLIAFDLSSIPVGAVVQSASLTLTFDRSVDTNVYPVSLYRLTRDWGEGTSNGGGSGSGSHGGTGAPATQNDATWLYTFYNASNPGASPTWTSPGADGDYLTGASASANIKGSMGILTPYMWQGSGVIADVQYWIDNPSANFGWLLKGDETTKDTSRRFESRQNIDNGTNGTPDAVPMLTVTYSVPEPSSVSLVCLAAAKLLARRR